VRQAAASGEEKRVKKDDLDEGRAGAAVVHGS
jgi:hypothetical protein